LLRTTVLA